MTAYQKAATGEWINPADIATMVRKALKAAFPQTKFSVRSSNCSVYVRWEDGPTQKEVDAVVAQFETRGFDGSIDMTHSYSLWLYPDGTASVAHGNGTSASLGFVPEVIGSSIKPGGVLCERIAKVFVSTSRCISPALKLKSAEALKAKRMFEEFEWSAEQIGEKFVVTGDQFVQRWGAWLSEVIDSVARGGDKYGIAA
jgi:hypothetical protein